MEWRGGCRPGLGVGERASDPCGVNEFGFALPPGGGGKDAELVLREERHVGSENLEAAVAIFTGGACAEGVTDAIGPEAH